MTFTVRGIFQQAHPDIAKVGLVVSVVIYTYISEKINVVLGFMFRRIINPVSTMIIYIGCPIKIYPLNSNYYSNYTVVRIIKFGTQV